MARLADVSAVAKTYITMTVIRSVLLTAPPQSRSSVSSLIECSLRVADVVLFLRFIAYK